MAAYTSISFYVQAHPDDWQLFRGEVGNDDLNYPGSKGVFVYLTAGDAGKTDGWWEAREQSAIASARAAIPPAPLTIEVVTLRNHPILRYTFGNSVSYFLRLPDGMSNGGGSATHGFQSLSHLRDSNKPMTTVDNSTTYGSWDDLCQTLQALMKLETDTAGETHPWLNVAEFDSARDPGDHPDHKATSDAVQTFARDQYNQALYLGYTIANKPANLSQNDYDKKKDVYDAYRNKMIQLVQENGQTPPVQEFQDEWNAWGMRSYYRLLHWYE